jgi:predicted homoserine dehydrogenase-like protein
MALDNRPSLVAEHWTAEVGAMSKRPLQAGEKIDGVGGMMVRGLIDDASGFARDGAVPLGVLAGATLKHDVPVDHLLTYDDVELDESSTIVRLRRMQDAMAESGMPSLDDLAALVRR